MGWLGSRPNPPCCFAPTQDDCSAAALIPSGLLAHAQGTAGCRVHHAGRVGAAARVWRGQQQQRQRDSIRRGGAGNGQKPVAAARGAAEQHIAREWGGGGRSITTFRRPGRQRRQKEATRGGRSNALPLPRPKQQGCHCMGIDPRGLGARGPPERPHTFDCECAMRVCVASLCHWCQLLAASRKSGVYMCYFLLPLLLLPFLLLLKLYLYLTMYFYASDPSESLLCVFYFIVPSLDRMG